uniref:Uncharacterized protein n=1 Tax=Strongyloides stercoralis TaxID=6248 RepID=A0A0K0ERM1_STRER
MKFIIFLFIIIIILNEILCFNKKKVLVTKQSYAKIGAPRLIREPDDFPGIRKKSKKDQKQRNLRKNSKKKIPKIKKISQINL